MSTYPCVAKQRGRLIQNNLLILVAVIAISIGFLCGGLFVLGLFVGRKKILASSLTHDHLLAGHVGTVQVPFDYRSKGKVTVYHHSSTQEILAVTDYPNVFSQGDRVLVIQVVDSHAWVVPGEVLDNS